MAKIVISYRRADTEAVTGRIRDRLVSHYGDDSVFMDIDSIPFGIDFRDYIKDALNHTDAILTIMGSRWTGKDGSEPARIMEETDPVRIEVETALARGIAVIPVLIDNAVMPQPSELPESLKNLAFRNAAYVDSGRDFHLHMDRLIRSMDKLLGNVAPGAAAAAERPLHLAGSADPNTGPRARASAAAVPPASIPQITAMAPPPKRAWVKWVVIGLSLPVVLIIALAIIGAFIGPQEKKPVPQTAQIQPPPANQPPSVPPQLAPPPATTPPAIPTPSPSILVPPSQPAGAGTAAAPKCKGGGKLAFQDNFITPALGWDDTSTSRFFADGQMVFQFKEPGLLTWLYRPVRVKNASVCGNVKSPMQANKLDGVASGGLVFWATDYSNYYLAQIYLDGTFQVYRRLSGEWIPVVVRTKSEHINSGLGAVNELQVTFKDSAGSFFANGHKLVDFRGQPPKNGGAVGLHGESEADRGGEWRFLDIAVSDEDQPAAKAPSAKATKAATTPMECKASSDTAFADDFKTPDQGWGATTATAYYEGGHMILKAAPNRTRTLLYLSLRYGNATMCANVKWPTNAVEPNEITSGGVAFWASGYSNFYEASIYRDGSYDVYRLVDDEWVAIVKKTASDKIRTAADAVNQVKVQMVDNKATLYINDAKVVEFWGQPPPRGGAVGLFAQSDKERSNDWRYETIAVVD